MTSLDAARQVIRVCRELAACTEAPGATTRRFLSPPMRDVHRRLAAWMERAGMRVDVDAAGNLRGRYPGSAEGPDFYIGSHLDTVPDAGAFDGVLGVALGVALVESLGGRRLPFGVEVIGFSEEEGVRFGVPFIGSRAFSGTLTGDVLTRQDADGISVAEAIARFGLDPAKLSGARHGPAIGYLEMHIEQGPALDDLGLPLGVVTAIVGQSRADVAFAGRAGHAGTTPMTARKDALAGAAEWISDVERKALAVPGLVATVGRLDVSPGGTNVVPGRATASLDVRHADDGMRRSVLGELAAGAGRIGARRGLDVGVDVRLDQATVSMHAGLTEALARAVERSGSPLHRMTSGAGHDAMVVAPHMPAALLFVRSPGGLSHHPDEAVLEQDVAAALAAGRRLLEDLADD